MGIRIGDRSQCFHKYVSIQLMLSNYKLVVKGTSECSIDTQEIIIPNLMCQNVLTYSVYVTKITVLI